MFIYLLETANIMFLPFLRFELLSFEHDNPIYHSKYEILFCGSFVRVQSSFFSPRGIGFPSHLFSAHFVLESLTYFHGKDLIVQSLYMYILRTEKQGGGKLMFMPFEIVSMCMDLVLFSETCHTAAYSHLHK